MEQLNFDSGIKKFQINGKGILRFNPSDPNVYARYMELTPRINEIEKNRGRNPGKSRKIQNLPARKR